MFAWRQIPFRSACCWAQTWANWHLHQAESGLSMESLWTPFQVHLQFPCFQFLLIFLGFCRLWGLWLHLLCIFVISPKGFLYHLPSSLQMPVSEWGGGASDSCAHCKGITNVQHFCSQRHGLKSASEPHFDVEKGHWEILWGVSGCLSGAEHKRCSMMVR